MLGGIGFVIAFLGYLLFKRVSVTVTRDPFAEAICDKGYAGCGLVWFTNLLMAGGAIMFLVCCYRYLKQQNAF